MEKLSRSVTMILAVIVALLVSIAQYRVGMESIQESAKHTLKMRASLLSQYIIPLRQDVYAMENTLRERYQEAQRTGKVAPEVEMIHPFPEYNVWGVSGLEREGGVDYLSGTLTGGPALVEPSEKLRQELTAALSLDSQFETLIKHIPEIIWVYYTSSKGFIYIAPDPPVANFRFSEELYSKEFWTQAEPANNPEGRQIISDLYNDAFGQGWMVSISSPVIVNEEFLGVASLDLGVDLLSNLTGIGEAYGDSILVDENDRIVARYSEFRTNETYSVPPTDQEWYRSTDGTRWLSEWVAAGELRLLHRLPNKTLYWAAAKQSALVWGLMLAMVVLVGFSIRLKEALSKVTTLMNRDELTCLLNRRGLLEAYPPLHELTRREGKQSALLLLDLDHFKEVNDTHGHGVGDQVLKTVARRLQANIRDHDLACRWGGEEILVFMANGDSATFRQVAQRLRKVIKEEPLSKPCITVTVSGGLTVFQEGEHLEKVISRADALLYRAKSEGRDRIVTDTQ